ncbi:MAG: response regulator, partial [Cellvibrionaceae bacterium]|nr:response regulator [Cellvibrionaceae bacterium]
MGNSILFVDDNPVNRQLLYSILSPEFSRLHQATDGHECLEKLRQTPIDLLLLDLNMPDLSGFNILEQLPKLKLAAAPTVIVVSADKDPTIISQALKGGAADYVTTPYHREELLARVKTHLAL